jgi:hypothetical protein
VALEWFERKMPGKSPEKKESDTSYTPGSPGKGKLFFPFLEDRPIVDVKAAKLLEGLRKNESGEAADTA